MNRKEKDRKKEIIRKNIDLANGRFKDDEIDVLVDIVTNFNNYIGQKKIIKSSHSGISSEGKYIRNEETTYTIKKTDSNIGIEENYHYYDDDGQTGNYTKLHKTGRDIINIYEKFFNTNK